MNIHDFIGNMRITMTATWIAERTDGQVLDMPAGSSHYRCVLRRSGDQRRTMTVYYSMGPAHTRAPEVADVLDCLLSDSSAIAAPRQGASCSTPQRTTGAPSTPWQTSCWRCSTGMTSGTLSGDDEAPRRLLRPRLI